MELVASLTVMLTALMASMFTALATLTGFTFLTFTFLVLPALLALTVLATIFVVILMTLPGAAIVRTGVSKAAAGAPVRANAEIASAKPKHADVTVFIKGSFREAAS